MEPKFVSLAGKLEMRRTEEGSVTVLSGVFQGKKSPRKLDSWEHKRNYDYKPYSNSLLQTHKSLGNQNFST